MKRGVCLLMMVLFSGCGYSGANVPIYSSSVPAQNYVEGMPYEEIVVEGSESGDIETVVRQTPVEIETLAGPAKTDLAAVPPRPSEKEVTVRTGDTVYSLSRKHNVPTRAMISLNNLTPPYILSIGQKLKLPDAPYYTVEKGDTLYGIARRFNVDVSQLASVNDIKSPYTLRVGQSLLLPGSVVRDEKAVSQKPAEKKEEAVKPPAKAPSRTQPETAVKKAPEKQTPAAVGGKTATGKTPDFSWPVSGRVITGYGGAGKGRHNDGICIAANRGTPVKASAGGTVVYTGSELPDFGNLVLIKHENGWVSAYAYLDEISAQKGKWVGKGAVIGKVGVSGKENTPQLHFELRKGVKAVNPLQYLKK